MNYNNPFSDFGKIVYGQRFVGRKKEVAIIQNRLLGTNYGNIAIMGLPRIGKSSLAYNSIYIYRDELIERKTYVFWINVGAIRSAKDFFLKLAFESFNEIKKQFENDDNQVFDKSFERINKTDLNEVEFNSYLQNYFRIIKSVDIKLIFILDEFDKITRIFRIEDFQLLREISTDPTTQVALLTVSRRTLRELEPEEGTVSNFYQIFSDLHLGFFSKQDTLLYWGFVKKHNIVISDETVNKITNYTSSHPFLLDLINNEIFDNIEGHNINFDEIFDGIINDLRLKILNEYGTILKLIEEEGLGSKVIQIIVGPVYNIKQVDIEKLQKYQLIKFEGNSYLGFCPYFNDFLMLSQREIDVWPLWSATESEIRAVIKLHLVEKYGKDWVTPFKVANPKKINTIDNLSITLNKSIKAFGKLASMDLVDYTYPSDMIDCFIHSDWSWFSKIFKKQFNDWKPIFDHLSKIRTPLAHNNLNFITEADRNRAIGYCQEIIKLIQDWKTSNN